MLPDVLLVRVALVDGCPTDFEANDFVSPDAGSSSSTTGFLECFAAELAQLRLDCGGPSACLLDQHINNMP